MKAQIIEQGGKFYKECSLIMLETNKHSPIALEEHGRLKFIGTMDNGYIPTSTQKTQHLYITDDSEIKEGDWCITDNKDTLYQISGKGSLRGLNKIIATTDKLLIPFENIGYDNSIHHLPSPSDKFIQAYIESYNQGNPIVKVLVEYRYDTNIKYGNMKMFDHNGDGSHYFCTNCEVETSKSAQEVFKLGALPTIPKLKDNNIIIKKMKDSWSREEVIKIAFGSFYKGFRDCEEELYCGADIKRNFDKWIEQNL